MSQLDQRVRRRRYERLRAAGFTAAEATKYKDRKDEIIDRLITVKEEQEARKASLFSDLDNEIKAVLDDGNTAE